MKLRVTQVLRERVVRVEQVILVDYENVQPQAEELQRLNAQRHLLKIFHGPGQNSIPVRLAAALLPIGTAVELIQCEKPGKDALDFHLAFHLGRLSVQHPQAELVIVSRDRKGFAQMVEHGIKLGCRVALVPSMLDALPMSPPSLERDTDGDAQSARNAAPGNAESAVTETTVAALPVEPSVEKLSTKKAAAKKTPAVKRPATLAAAKKVSDQPVAAKTTAATAHAGATTAEKPPKKAAAKTATKKANIKKAAAKNAATKKTVAKKPPTRTPAARKVSAAKKSGTSSTRKAAAHPAAAQFDLLESMEPVALDEPVLVPLPAAPDTTAPAPAPAPVPPAAPAAAPTSAPTAPTAAPKSPRELPSPSDITKAVQGLNKVAREKRPAKTTALRRHLESHLRADLTEAGVAALLQTLYEQGWVSEGPGGKVDYHLPKP